MVNRGPLGEPLGIPWDPLGPLGGSNEPAFRSQIPLWDPLGTPGGARAPPEGPLDDVLVNFEFRDCSTMLHQLFFDFSCFLY